MRHGKTFTLNPKGCLPTDVWSMPSGDSSVLHYATRLSNIGERQIRMSKSEMAEGEGRMMASPNP
jgi:hypothetical protein